MMIEEILKPATPLHEILDEVKKNSSNIWATFDKGKEFAIWKDKGLWWCERNPKDPVVGDYEIYARSNEDCIKRIQNEYYEK